MTTNNPLMDIDKLSSYKENKRRLELEATQVALDVNADTVGGRLPSAGKGPTRAYHKASEVDLTEATPIEEPQLEAPQITGDVANELLEVAPLEAEYIGEATKVVPVEIISVKEKVIPPEDPTPIVGEETSRIIFQNSQFTPKQLETLKLVSEGLTCKEIGAKWNCSIKTVEAHRSATLKKLEARNSCHAVALAFRYGVLE